MRRGLVLLVVGVVFAGCGGGDDGDRPARSPAESAYVEQVQAAGARVQGALADISDQGGGTVTAASYGAALDKSVAALDRAVKELDAITPPARAASAHALMVEGCRELSGAFRATADAARKDDPAALARALRDVSAGDGAKKIGQAQAQLKALGIAFGG